MRISLKEPCCRVARWCTGLLLALLGLFTISLFLTTGRSMPRDFIPVGQLSFRMLEQEGSRDDDGEATFRCLNPSGRCLFTSHSIFSDPSKADADYISLDILDTATLKRLGSVRRYRNDDGFFEISPDRQLLAGLSNGRLHLQDVKSGKDRVADIRTPWDEFELTFAGPRVVFSPGGRQLLNYSAERAVHYDLIEHRTLATFHAEGNSLSDCFFDVRGRPKALIDNLDTDQLEIWDITSNRKDATLNQTELRKQGILESQFASSGDVFLAASILTSNHSNKELLLIRSLEDGYPLQTLSFPIKDAEFLHFSPDGRFLICSHTLQNPLVRIAEGRHTGLANWLAERFPDVERLALFDLKGGMVWNNLLGNRWCAFTDDGTRLFTFTNEGRYEYDVPPRWQHFTPWAWAAPGAWLIVAFVWWRLREGHGMARLAEPGASRGHAV